jgi:hypothetical protein
MVSRPEVAAVLTRTTPWSKPTPPSIVPRDVEVFLADVDPGANGGKPTAHMEIIEWLPDVGTLVKKTLPIALGSRITGRAATDVIEPGVTLEEREVAFAAPAVVVDTEAGPAPPKNLKSFHAELKLPNGQLDAVEQTLVVNESGELEVLSPYSDVPKQKELRDYYDGLLGYHEPFRPAVVSEATMGEEGGLDFLMGEEGAGSGEGSDMYGTPQPRRGRYSRPRNPLARRGAGGAGGGGHGGEGGGGHGGP